MPRLTLLFFSAAKDVPEAARMVTAGTARHLFEQFGSCKPKVKYGPAFKPCYGL